MYPVAIIVVVFVGGGKCPFKVYER